jgi:DNA invertase Pin-like site-specific DNA recombinase
VTGERIRDKIAASKRKGMWMGGGVPLGYDVEPIVTGEQSSERLAVPMVQAIVRSLAVNAAKGNQRAQRLFTNILSANERERCRSYEEWQTTAINYKVEW